MSVALTRAKLSFAHQKLEEFLGTVTVSTGRSKIFVITRDEVSRTTSIRAIPTLMQQAHA
ncbi:hypothetical protein HSR121_0557 [Halapricum desulfuricans]|uniref:Uncharacterized protein n=1 Tax=Halapricum desulfuricans TaxID=2841257 RepID=A0A897MWE9_9EURY|nr:hypothetical protein HSR121_0557 [Halapricum desulfuricans]